MQKQVIYKPPMVQVTKVLLEECLADGVQCSPINHVDIKVEDWIEEPDVYGDVYILDTW